MPAGSRNWIGACRSIRRTFVRENERRIVFAFDDQIEKEGEVLEDGNDKS